MASALIALVVLASCGESGGELAPEEAPAVTAPAADPEPVYRSCAEAAEAGVTDLERGDPGYRSALDGDGDGTACESGG